MDLNNFLNDFENTLDNRGKIEEEKEDIFDDIVKNLLSYLNKDNLDEITLKVIKRSEFENVTIKIMSSKKHNPININKLTFLPLLCRRMEDKNHWRYETSIS